MGSGYREAAKLGPTHGVRLQTSSKSCCWPCMLLASLPLLCSWLHVCTQTLPQSMESVCGLVLVVPLAWAVVAVSKGEGLIRQANASMPGQHCCANTSWLVACWDVAVETCMGWLSSSKVSLRVDSQLSSLWAGQLQGLRSWQQQQGTSCL